MALRILLYFGILIVGFLLSSRGYVHKKLAEKISLLQTIILFVLILIMGIRVGMDDQVVSSIGQIGIMAATFAVFTAGFSVLFVHIARKKFIHDKNITGDLND